MKKEYFKGEEHHLPSVYKRLSIRFNHLRVQRHVETIRIAVNE
jgi:hypothetical protein